MPEIPEPYLSLGSKLIGSLIVILLTLIVNRIVRDALRKRFREADQATTLRMLIRNAVLVGASIVILMIWLGTGSSFTVAMGILGAGIAFASQEVIGSFSGFISIVGSSMYRIGDRVSIGEVTGDVVDISLLRTSLLEVGEWVKADQPTGRIVTIANRAVFSDPVFNYTKIWPYIWDEITIPITYNSDWRRALEIMLEHGEEYTAHLQAAAQAGLDALDRRYPAFEDTPVTPSLYTVMTDNWIEMTMRYVVEARQRREVKAELHRELLIHFEEEADITVASATFEIVGFPPLHQV
ncbi:MAG: mechanosensitive ion channel family protein [Anaerolineae bacterium]